MDRLWQWLRLVKPYLYLLILYVVVAWFLENHRGPSLAAWLVIVPALVGEYVWFRCGDALKHYAHVKPFELIVSLSFWPPKGVHEHPAMKAAHEIAMKKWDELKQGGREDHWTRLLSSSPYSGRNAPGIRLIYRQGLRWLETGENQTFVEEVYVAGRIYGDALGLAGSEQSRVEPSIVITESFGVLSVLLVPVQASNDNPFLVGRERDTSERRAADAAKELLRNKLLNRKKIAVEDPPPIVLAQFPLQAAMALFNLPENAVSCSKWEKMMSNLEKEYGLRPPEKNRGDPDFDTSWQLNTDYVAFRFRSWES